MENSSKITKKNMKSYNGSNTMRAAKKGQKSERRKDTQLRKQQNERWHEVERTGKYRRAIGREIYHTTTIRIEAEVMDGILLNLNDRNCDKPMSVQLRLLRRIVEKRQAQANHEKNGRSNSRRTTVINISHTSKNMERLQRRRQAS